MKKNSSNVYDAGWLDIVFNNRNKVYGAYALRMQSGSILTQSFFIAITVFLLLFAGPYIYRRAHPIEYATPVSLTDIKAIFQVKVQQPKQPEGRQQLPKAEKVMTKKFTANIQVVKTPIAEKIPTLEELKDVVIGTVNQEGPVSTVNTLPSAVSAGTGAGTVPSEDTGIYNYSTVESYPEFDGGMKAWIKYMQKNLKYPFSAQEEGVQGKVYVSFVVEIDGSITDVTVLKGIGAGCDEEAVRVIKNAPKWKAGRQHNIPVRVRYNMPISFSLL